MRNKLGRRIVLLCAVWIPVAFGAVAWLGCGGHTPSATVEARAAEEAVESLKRYTPDLPDEVAKRAARACARLAEEMQKMESQEISEVQTLLSKLRIRRTREAAYQDLLRTDKIVIPVAVSSYFAQDELAARRDILALLPKRCNKDNYPPVLAFLERECFRKDDVLRVSAIHAVAEIMRRGTGWRGHDVWLTKKHLDEGTQVLLLLANSQDAPYPYWQRVAGRQLYSLGRGDLIPEQMREAFKRGPQE